MAIPTEYTYVTWTPDPRMMVNLSGTETAEAMPRATALPEMTVSLALPTTEMMVVDGTVTPISAPLIMPFTIEDPGVLYTPNANGRGCNWASIGGTVTGLDGAAICHGILQWCLATKGRGW